MPIVFDGNRVARVSAELAAAFAPGDALLVVPSSGELLRVPAAVRALVQTCVADAVSAFAALNSLSDQAITGFFRGFAERLEDDHVWQRVEAANQADVSSAQQRGRSTTRLKVSPAMRRGMIEGLRGWTTARSRRGESLESVQHDAFRVELVGAALGVVGFVFEGRPNVVADATGVLRGGNAVVFRIGGDALGTARALMEHALTPALEAAGLPKAAVTLVPSAEHAAGWALFSDPRLSLAVARGSGSAVDTLGALAQQAGVPVSLHGTGGAWLMAAQSTSEETFEAAVFASLDRKVCNTLNVCCVPRSRAGQLWPAFLRGLERAAARAAQASGVDLATQPRAGRDNFKLHVAEGSESCVAAELFRSRVPVRRATGIETELQAELLPVSELGEEWEWEATPEVTWVVVDGVSEAVELFNRHSPRFVASLLSDDAAEHARFFAQIDAPFVGDGYTRWVDGQIALRKPELGLSNWQHGRLFGRGGILSGDTVYTVRARYVTCKVSS
jgi:glutamate-5-semialdehyde dehydrogenase